MLIGGGLAPGRWTTIYLAALLAVAVLTVLNRARHIVAASGPRAP